MRARAVLVLGATLACLLVPTTASAGMPVLPTRVARPSIVWRPIPFGERRRAEMGAYSRRHYGEWTWRLRRPKVIVEHYTDGTTFSGAWATFAANAVHLGELPGVCAHFVIDTDGTIYQLVNLHVRCRHAIGMNWTAIGIEHVGTSDQQILSNPRMMRVVATHGMAHGSLRDPGSQRDRSCRDPDESVPPRGVSRLAMSDARRLAASRHAALPRTSAPLGSSGGGARGAPARLGRPALLSPANGRSFALARSGDAAGTCPGYDAPVRLLRSPDFRLLAFSNGLSSLGDELALVALTIKVFELSNGSGIAVAAVLLAGIVPLVVFAPFAGLLVDRTETTGTLALASVAQALIAVGLAFAEPVWLVVALSFLLGSAASVASPAVFAIVPTAVDEEDLTEANANMETVRYIGMVAGPLIAGGLAGALGADRGTRAALLLDAITFLVITSAAASPQGPSPARGGPEGSGARGARRARRLRVHRARPRLD